MAESRFIGGKTWLGGITYSGIEEVNTALGFGSFTVYVDSTPNSSEIVSGDSGGQENVPSSSTIYELGNGDSDVYVSKIDGPVYVYGKEGNDRIFVTSDSGLFDKNLQSLLAFDGRDGLNNVYLYNTQANSNNVGVLTHSYFDGFGWRAGTNSIFHINVCDDDTNQKTGLYV